MSRFWRDQRGFTLIEMMTVVSIMFVLSGLVIASTQVGNRRQQLRDAAAGFIGAAANAESLAGGSRTLEGTSRKAYGVLIPAGSNPASFQLYGRTTADTGTDVDAAIQRRPDRPTVVTSYQLPRDLVFVTSDVWLDYLPPSPTMRANGSTADRTVTIRHSSVQNCTGSKDCITIRIRPLAGAVYVQ